MLHILTRSPFSSHSFAQCRSLLAEGDAILLIQDAVVAITDTNRWFTDFENAGVKIYLLEPDLAARGFGVDTNGEIHLVDYKGFVSLTVEHESQMKWD